jgi:hypothetical protein
MTIKADNKIHQCVLFGKLFSLFKGGNLLAQSLMLVSCILLDISFILFAGIILFKFTKEKQHITACIKNGGFRAI